VKGNIPGDGKWMSGRRIGLADHKKRFKKIGLEEGQQTKPPETSGRLTGNLRFPLDFTYHGCPQNSSIDWQHLLKTRLQIGRKWEHGMISRNCLSITIGMIYRKAIPYQKMPCQDIFHKLSC